MGNFQDKKIFEEEAIMEWWLWRETKISNAHETFELY